MRRTLALTALLAVAACWTGCSSGKSPSANSPATNPNTTAPSTSGGNMSNANRPMNTSAPPTTVGSTPPGGIKPPMRDEKKK